MSINLEILLETRNTINDRSAIINKLVPVCLITAFLNISSCL